MGGRKKRGHKLPPGKFVAIPINLLKEVAGELTAPELRCWFALCAQSQPWSNGTAKLCRSVVKEFHLGSQRVVTAATRKLIDSRRIVQTRKPVQRKCALYGVTHVPLNHDALAKEGVGEPASSDTNRGSASSATNGEAQVDEIDNRGSAKLGNQALALPKSRNYVGYPTSLALPQGNTSKNLPLPSADSARAPSSESQSAHPPSPTHSRESSPRRVRIAGSTPTDIVRDLISSGWSDAQVHEFARKQKLAITLDDIRAISARAGA